MARHGIFSYLFQYRQTKDESGNEIEVDDAYMDLGVVMYVVRHYRKMPLN